MPVGSGDQAEWWLGTRRHRDSSSTPVCFRMEGAGGAGGKWSELAEDFWLQNIYSHTTEQINPFKSPLNFIRLIYRKVSEQRIIKSPSSLATLPKNCPCLGNCTDPSHSNML